MTGLFRRMLRLITAAFLFSFFFTSLDSFSSSFFFSRGATYTLSVAMQPCLPVSPFAFITHERPPTRSNLFASATVRQFDRLGVPVLCVPLLDFSSFYDRSTISILSAGNRVRVTFCSTLRGTLRFPRHRRCFIDSNSFASRFFSSASNRGRYSFFHDDEIVCCFAGYLRNAARSTGCVCSIKKIGSYLLEKQRL